MPTKPRRLHSVPTGPDVMPGSGSSGPGPNAESGTTPTDTQVLMERIGRSGEADDIHTRRGPALVAEQTPADDPQPPHRRLADLPVALRELLSRSSVPLGSALQDLLSHIDFGAPLALGQVERERLAAGYSWLLRRVGADGLALTAAGYLRPVDVSAGFTELNLESQWCGIGNREGHVRPLRRLRESAEQLGLLRRSNGRLCLTRAGIAVRDKPAELVEWAATRLPIGRQPHERDAGLALLTALAAGGDRPDRSIDDLVADVLTGLRRRDSGGTPVTPPMAHQAARPTATVLIALGALVWLPQFATRTVTSDGVEFARSALLLAPVGKG